MRIKEEENEEEKKDNYTNKRISIRSRSDTSIPKKK